jgi:hypothetical protein
MAKVATNPKYSVGECVIVNSWTQSTECEVLEVAETYHPRMGEYTWGYRVNKDTGFTFVFIPEGYLRKIN